jgi:cell wall-associated NlpC family hydrolase
MPDRGQGIMKVKDEATFHTATGVDCSGLVNLTYRVNNIEVPRDAHDQWIAAKKLVPEQCGPADLAFVSSEKTYDKITHVMIYLGGEEVIEASETGSVVFINTFKKKFGLTFHEAEKQGFIVNDRRIYFGSLLNSLEKNELC